MSTSFLSEMQQIKQLCKSDPNSKEPPMPQKPTNKLPERFSVTFNKRDGSCKVYIIRAKDRWTADEWARGQCLKIGNLSKPPFNLKEIR